MFDNVVDAAAVGPRERYEAVARSVRDVLSQRWLRTEQTYERENPKRVYYLSMEFLIGRSLANNITEPPARSGRASGSPTTRASTGSACSSRSPTPASATAGSAASRRASSTRWRRCSSRPWATGCATSTASSGRRSRTAGSASSRTTGCGGPIRGRSPGRRSRWRSSSAARSRCAAAACGVVVGRPSSLLGLPFDRPVVGYGGKTINTLRLWAAAAPDYLRLPGVQRRRVRERAGRAARGRIPDPGPLSRRLHEHGAGPALRAGVFPRRLLAGGPRAALPPEQCRLERASRQGRHPAQRHPPQPGRARADADPARRGAASAGTRPGTSPGGRSPTPTTRCCPRRWRSGRCGGSSCCCRVIWRSSSRSTAACSTRCGPASRATRAASSA